ncbi:MAG: alpha/beta fold hydrolase [Balneolaceae bacterium]
MRFYADGAYYHLTIHQHKKRLPYLMLLHGFMGSQLVFSPLVKPISSFCNPVTIDLLGHGNTTTDPDPNRFTTDRQVSDLDSILYRLAFYDLYLYGYSMGGRLAFQILVSHPHYFKGAVIESAHCGLISEEEKDQRKKLDEERAAAIKADFEGFLSEWMDLPLFRSAPGKQNVLYSEVMKSQDPRLIAASLQGFGAGVMPEVCSKLKNLTMPVQLISGEHDQKYGKIMSGISQQDPLIRHTVVSGAGHRVHADKPEDVLTVIKKFL